MTDLEAEYNNRARVPEFEQIFERWSADAASYRERSTAQGRAELGVSYGPSKRQYLDVFLPERGTAAPLALFIHGGYWRALNPTFFSHVANGLNTHGMGVAMCGYDLCPAVRVGDIIAQVRQACLHVWRRSRQRVFVYGHSAGGHLAAALLATDWRSLDASAPADLVPIASSFSGVFDLTPLVGLSMNAELRLTEAEAREVSPLFWRAPQGRVLDVFVGGAESGEFLRQSKVFAEAWSKAGVLTRYEEVARANHFTVLDPLSDPNSTATARLVSLARQAMA